jgi:hypothetical protein
MSEEPGTYESRYLGYKEQERAELEQLELNHDERAEHLIDVLGIEFHRTKSRSEPMAATSRGCKTRARVKDIIKSIMYQVEGWR